MRTEPMLHGLLLLSGLTFLGVVAAAVVVQHWTFDSPPAAGGNAPVGPMGINTGGAAPATTAGVDTRAGAEIPDTAVNAGVSRHGKPVPDVPGVTGAARPVDRTGESTPRHTSGKREQDASPSRASRYSLRSDGPASTATARQVSEPSMMAATPPAARTAPSPLSTPVPSRDDPGAFTPATPPAADQPGTVDIVGVAHSDGAPLPDDSARGLGTGGSETAAVDAGAEEPDLDEVRPWPSNNCPERLPAGSTRAIADVMTQTYGCQYLQYCQALNDGSGGIECWWGAWRLPGG